MIGKINPAAGKSVVVGGGVSGLLAAVHLARRGQRVELFESKERLGGLIQTRALRPGIAESAAHSLRASKAVRELFDELHLDWVPAKPEAKSKFLIRNGRLSAWPFGFFETLSVLLRAPFLPARDRDATLSEWAERHLGGVAPAMRAMARGIYGSEPEELIARLAFPKFTPEPGWPLLPWMFRMKREKGIVAAAARAGMSAFIQALDKEARNLQVVIRTGTPIEKGSLEEFFASSQPGFNLILTAPAPDCAPLVAPVDAALSRGLSLTPYGSLTCVTAFVSAKAFTRRPSGTGALSMDRGDSRLLGILFNSSSFPGRVVDEDAHVSLTLMLRGEGVPSRADLEMELAKYFGIPEEALEEYDVSHWARALPRYGLALEEAWRGCSRLCESRPGLVFFGNWTGEISLRGLIETARGFRTP